MQPKNREPLNNTGKWHQQLPVRLGLWVVFSVAVILVAAMFVMFSFSRQSIGAEAMERAQQMLDCTAQKINNSLRRVEVASRNMCWNVEHHLDNPDGVSDYCLRFLRDNPNVMGCAIAFVPNYYRAQGKGELYMSYWHRLEKGSDELMLTNDPTVLEPTAYSSTPYMGANWFFIPMQANTTVWVRPHVPGERFLSSIVTCSTPIHDQTGSTVGVFAVDIPLDDISRTVLATKPYPHSYSAMLGVQGTYLIHPDSTMLYNRLVNERVAEEPDERVEELVKSMLAGESGYRKVTLKGEDCYVFYEGLNEKHWSACIVCPESDIFEGHQHLTLTMTIVAVLGILFLFLVCVQFASLQLRAIPLIDESARRLAKNDFSSLIPASTRQDEIGDLQNSFRTMQQSLEQNIRQANDLSAELHEHESQLLNAYEQAKAVDRMKNDILHKHADQMVPVASAIDSAVNEIKNKQATLMQSDLQPLSDKIVRNAHSLNAIVDDMLSIPQSQ